VTLDWVIVGGESGPGARPCDVRWIELIVARCGRHRIPVFVKQLGAHSRIDTNPVIEIAPIERLLLKHRKGGDMTEWPLHLRVRQYPETSKGPSA